MALPLILGPIVSMLANAGADLAADAIRGGKEKAKEFIEDKTGLNLDSEKGLSSKDIQKLKDMENDPKIKIELQTLALERLKEVNRHNETLVVQSNKNTADSRESNEIIQTSKNSSYLAKNFLYYFTGLWTIFAMVYMGFITFGTIPDDNVRFADTILGFLLGTIVASIVNFFVGSSNGSKEKTEALHSVIKKQN